MRVYGFYLFFIYISFTKHACCRISSNTQKAKINANDKVVDFYAATHMACWWWRLNGNCLWNARTEIHTYIHTHKYGICTGINDIGVRSAHRPLNTLLVGTDTTEQQQQNVRISNFLLCTQTHTRTRRKKTHVLCIRSLRYCLVNANATRGLVGSPAVCILTAFLRHKSSWKKLWCNTVGSK